MAKKKSNPVYSARIPEEILETYKEQCERMNVPHNYIISEYMKKFIVLNIGRESYEAPILEKENKNENEDLSEILDDKE